MSWIITRKVNTIGRNWIRGKIHSINLPLKRNLNLLLDKILKKPLKYKNQGEKRESAIFGLNLGLFLLILYIIRN
jgi:hypothetical protein